MNAWKSVTKAVCVIRSTDGNTAKGIVHFAQVGDSVQIEAEISGLKPGAKHGFHIHQFGDVSLGNGKSAGGHYNPEGHDHAGPGEVAYCLEGFKLGHCLARSVPQSDRHSVHRGSP